MPQPVGASYLQLVYTGGENNNDPLLSLGGAFGQTFIFDPLQHSLDELLENLFPNITPDEQAEGKTRYRAIGVKNSHPDGTMYFLKLKLTKAFGDVQFFFAWAPEEPNTPPQQIANETTPPSNVTTWHPVNSNIQMQEQHLGSLAVKGIWFKCVVPPGAGDQAYEYPAARFTWGAVGA